MRSYLTLLALTATLLHIQGQVVLNEVIYSPQQTVELKNVGSTTIEVGTLWLCSFPTYTQIQNMTVVSGTTTMAPGDILVVSGHGYAAADDELGLYTANSFGNSANIIDYVEWGSTGHARSSVAVAAGIWTTGDFVDNVGGAASLEYDGEGDASSDWAVSVVSTEGQENSNVDVPCDASAFAVGSQTICPGDTAVFQVVLTGIAPWTFTYSRDGVIEEPVNTSLSPHPWELTLEGTYNLVSVTDATCEG
ncbi:MAG: hypothetical protein HKO93_01000, partial [Flavobacteriales bacterium]|nr:hypothetical protein [Flavobacteriales bacterium]